MIKLDLRENEERERQWGFQSLLLYSLILIGFLGYDLRCEHVLNLDGLFLFKLLPVPHWMQLLLFPTPERPVDAFEPLLAQSGTASPRRTDLRPIQLLLIFPVSAALLVILR